MSLKKFCPICLIHLTFYIIAYNLQLTFNAKKIYFVKAFTCTKRKVKLSAKRHPLIYVWVLFFSVVLFLVMLSVKMDKQKQNK